MPSVAPAAAATPLVLAIDLGTSSVRVLAVDSLGRAIEGSEEQQRYAIGTSADGAAEMAALPLFDLLIDTIDGALARLGPLTGEIAAVGFTAFWHGLLGLGADGAPATPIFYWGDTRSAPDAAALRHEADEAATLDRTGCRLHSSYWPAKLRWLERTRPAQNAEVARWTGLAEYAFGRLCLPAGLGMSFSMASGTGLLDVHRLAWDDGLLDVLGLAPDRLPPLVDLRSAATLGPDWAARWPALAGKPWFPALGDGACANVGSGAVGPDRIALTLGTSGAVRLVVPAPPGSVWQAPTSLWAYRLDRDRAVLGGAVSNGGNLLAWLWSLL
ncbi:MAG TPA: FGGY family carbohydrate kinase, partial [Thermomicrobiales bacterium]|nr:FGGY family carbohydrate kinase [Thermomicrobiales bacterium]